MTVTSEEDMKTSLKMITDRKKEHFDKTVRKTKTNEEERRNRQEDIISRQEETAVRRESERSTYLPVSRPEVDTGMRPEFLHSSLASPTPSRMTCRSSGGTASPGGGGRGLEKSYLISTIIPNINTFHADKPRLPRISVEQRSTAQCKDDGLYGVVQRYGRPEESKNSLLIQGKDCDWSNSPDHQSLGIQTSTQHPEDPKSVQ